MKKLIIFLLSASIMVGVLAVANKPSTTEPELQLKVQPPIPSVLPPEPKPITFDDAKSAINEQNIRQIIEFLCSNELEGRMSGQPGNDKAADFIFNKFKEYGLETSKQEFQVAKVNDHKKNSTGRTNNVIGVLRGGERCFVVGSHLDHIGFGPSYSRTPNRREIHPGADDNASGTSALLELARVFSLLKGQNKHTIIFIAFSAEEMGLIGAEYYVNHPIIPLSQIDFMCNFDMIGRFKDSVDFMGAGSIDEFRSCLQEVINDSSLKVSIKTLKNAGGGSDHAAFSKKGIPVTFIHTGLHSDYHAPSDLPNRINYEGIRKISQWSFHYCWLLDKRNKFSKVDSYVPNVKWRDHGEK